MKETNNDSKGNANNNQPSSPPPSLPRKGQTIPVSNSSTSTSNSSNTTASASSSSSSNPNPITKSLSSSPPPKSMFWSTWISPSSSASAAASSALESKSSGRPARKRPTFEEFRAQEPPQARLIRLRGLFDTLLDSDDDHALAGGRAKNEWTKSAMRARYGAGGSMARGSLAPKGKENGALTQESGSSSSGSSGSNNASSDSNPSSSNSSKRIQPPPPAPPLKQSYASELLSQCRACRKEVEEERERERNAHLKSNSQDGWNWNDFVSWVPGVSSTSSSSDAADASSNSQKSSSSPEEKGKDSNSSSKIDNLKETLSNLTSSSSSSKSSISSSSSSSTDSSSTSSSSTSSTLASLSSLFSFSSTDSKTTESHEHHTTDQEGEAGWTGSKVWGLSAVGSKQREKDRELDQRVLKGQEVEDDGGKRQRQIEWEGFLKYAEGKERELYKIFSELDKNVDMRLDAAEIRTALERAGIDVHPLGLQDFIASLASSTSIASSNSSISGSGNIEKEKVYVTFPEFRDYLLLLPRKPSVNEIFRFYQVRKAFGLFGMGGIFAEFGAGWGKTERGATAVNFDGDVSLAGEEKKSNSSISAAKKEAKKAEVEEKNKAEEIKKSSSSNASTSSTGASLIGGEESSSDSKGPTGTGTADPIENSKSSSGEQKPSDQVSSSDQEEDEEEEEEDNDMIHGEVAVKFLLAGGIAGAVSRTATAPFDRLKIYLITTARSTATAEAVAGNLKGKNTVDQTAKLASKGAGILKEALFTLYKEGGGLKAFWLGNGLNCVKIFPESAIKFLSYETSKRAFAKYVDEVSDSRDISGSSRFLSGGIGGITSQLAIYPIETLKTRLMSSSNGGNSPNALKGNALLLATAKDMWKNGGMRTYYRGLVAGLVGVFPYSAIDMSTFEGIKLFYIKYTGKEEPGVLALLAFGSVSGSVGATTVYPLNLVRTRLQAAGTPAHPVVYDGFADAVRKTYRQEGMVGFYRGLVPTLAKVVPAVSISYVVYEQGKRKLGVQ